MAKKSTTDAKKDKRAAALRANLRRRKEKVRDLKKDDADTKTKGSE